MEFHGVLKKVYECVKHYQGMRLWGWEDGCAVKTTDCFYIGSLSASQEPPLPETVAPLNPAASSGL